MPYLVKLTIFLLFLFASPFPLFAEEDDPYTNFVVILKGAETANVDTVKALAESHAFSFPSAASQGWAAVTGRFDEQDLIAGGYQYYAWYWGSQAWITVSGWEENPDDANFVLWPQSHAWQFVGDAFPVPGGMNISGTIPQVIEKMDEDNSKLYSVSGRQGIESQPDLKQILQAGYGIVMPSDRGISSSPYYLDMPNLWSPLNAGLGNGILTTDGSINTPHATTIGEADLYPHIGEHHSGANAWTAGAVARLMYNHPAWNFWDARAALYQTAWQYQQTGQWVPAGGYGLINLDAADALETSDLILFGPPNPGYKAESGLYIEWSNFAQTKWASTKAVAFSSEPQPGALSSTGTTVYSGTGTRACLARSEYAGKWLGFYSVAADLSESYLQPPNILFLDFAVSDPAFVGPYCLEITASNPNNRFFEISWSGSSSTGLTVMIYGEAEDPYNYQLQGVELADVTGNSAIVRIPHHAKTKYLGIVSSGVGLEHSCYLPITFSAQIPAHVLHGVKAAGVVAW